MKSKTTTIEEEKKLACEKWEEFYSDSTMHGFRAAFGSRSFFRRMIWRVLLLGALLFTGYLFYGVLNQYLQYDFKVSKQIHFDLENLNFPRVTICNMNSVSNKKLREFDLGIDSQLWLKFYHELRYGKLNVSSTKNQEILQKFYDRNITSYYEILSNFELGKKEMLDDPTLQNVFSYTCRYQEKVCTTANFLEIYTMDYGKCIAFPRYGDYKEKALKVERNDKGLRLILNVHEDEMMDSRSIFNGLVVFIHPHNETINSAMSKKIFVAPGTL